MPEPDLVRLIQAFDEYTVAFTQNKPAFQLARDTLQVDRQLRPSLNNMMLVGTQLAGHWKATVRGTGAAARLEIRVQAYGPITRALTAGVADEAARQATVLGLAGSTSEVEEIRDRS